MQSQHDLINQIAMDHRPGNAEAIEAWFLAMALPLPAQNEFTPTNDNGYLVFLNRVACVVRITAQAIAPHPRDFDILQPLLRKKAEDCVIDINPGIICPIPQTDFERLARKRDFDTGSEYNAGILPGMVDKNGLAYSVIIDPAGIEKISQSVSIVKNKLKKISLPKKSPQEILYGPLKKLFSKAWPDKAEQPEGIKLRAAWRKCLQMKESGQLVASWTDSEIQNENYKNVQGGNLYAARWQGPI